MDPYLEGEAVWADFQSTLAVQVSAELNRTLPAPYYARLRSRPEAETTVGWAIPRRNSPAVAVLDRPRRDLSRSYQITLIGYEVFPCGLREWLSCLPVPLKEGEDEVPLDLQFVFNRAYDSGPYLRGAVDYTKPPDPPLSPDAAAWAEELIRARGLLGS
jgi:hypothetical protein